MSLVYPAPYDYSHGLNPLRKKRFCGFCLILLVIRFSQYIVPPVMKSPTNFGQ
jgi:hypothetical protein